MKLISPKPPAASAVSVGVSLSQRGGSSIQRFNKLRDSISSNIHTAIPGVITAFSAGPPVTVDVQPAIIEKVRYKGLLTDVTLPVIPSVPVIFPWSGQFAFTMPVNVGDECLLFFADVCTDAWLEKGCAKDSKGNYQASPWYDPRRHDVSDAFALIGIANHSRQLSDYSTDSIQLRTEDGAVIVDIADNQVTVSAPTVAVNSTGTVQVSAENVQVSATNTCSINAETIDLVGTNVNINSAPYALHEHFQSATNMPPTTGKVVPI